MVAGSSDPSNRPVSLTGIWQLTTFPRSHWETLLTHLAQTNIHVSGIREEARNHPGPTSHPPRVAWRAGIGTEQGTEAGHSPHFCLWPAQQGSLREEILAPFTGTNIPSGYKTQLQFVECP